MPLAARGFDISFSKKNVQPLGKADIEGYTLGKAMLQDECSFTHFAKNAVGLDIIVKVYYTEQQVLQGYSKSHKNMIMNGIKDRYDNELEMVEQLNAWKQKVKEQEPQAEYNLINYIGPVTSNVCMGFEIEYCEGEDLQSYLDTRIEQKRQGQDVEELLESTIRTLVKQLLNGVHTLNRARIAHCDVRPTNVLYTKEGTLKIMNLGLSRKLEDGQSAFQGTYGGVVERDFCPPEALGLTQLSLLRKASDCWPIAAIMFTLTTNSPWKFFEWLSKNNNSIKGVTTQVKRQVKKAKGNISDEALDVMRALLNEDVAKRPYAYWTATAAPWFKNDMHFRDSSAAWAQGAAARDDGVDSCIFM